MHNNPSQICQRTRCPVNIRLIYLVRPKALATAHMPACNLRSSEYVCCIIDTVPRGLGSPATDRWGPTATCETRIISGTSYLHRRTSGYHRCRIKALSTEYEVPYCHAAPSSFSTITAAHPTLLYLAAWDYIQHKSFRTEYRRERYSTPNKA